MLATSTCVVSPGLRSTYTSPLAGWRWPPTQHCRTTRWAEEHCWQSICHGEPQLRCPWAAARGSYWCARQVFTAQPLYHIQPSLPRVRNKQTVEKPCAATHRVKKQNLTYMWARNSSALRGQKGTKASLLQSGSAASLSSAGLTLPVRWPSSPSLCKSALQEPPCMDSLLSTRVTSSLVEACHQD